jgi:hypothetical protein
MEFLIVIGIGAAIWIYANHQEKQKKAKAIIACREELINAFPAHASQLSEGVAAMIIADSYKKKGLAQKFEAARAKFVKRKDHAEPEDKQSAKTRELGIDMLGAIFDYHEQVVGRLPENLQAELNNLPLSNRHDAILQLLSRTWARVN